MTAPLDPVVAASTAQRQDLAMTVPSAPSLRFAGITASVLAVLLLAWSPTGPGLMAADAGTAQTKAEVQAEKAQLRMAFATRESDLAALKAAGTLGETTDGLVAVPDGQTLDAAGTTLADAENQDRQRLYDLLAGETGVTAEVVAERNARRNFSAATSGQWLRGNNGKWVQKK